MEKTLEEDLRLPEAYQFVKLRNFRLQLQRSGDDIIRVRQGWKNFHLNANSQHLPGSSCRQSESTAMIKLESALQIQNLHPKVLECIKWVGDELSPLHDFLQEIDNVQVLGEGQKMWIQELRAIFQSTDDSVAEEKGGRKNQFFFCRCGNPNIYSINLAKIVTEIQDKILQFYRRYSAYGFEEILATNGSRFILPRIRMYTPIPSVWTSDTDTTLLPVDLLISYILRSIFTPSVLWGQSTYLSLPGPEASIELLRVDLKLMKALLEDSRSMGDLDKRAKVWLNQLQEIAVDLESLLDECASNASGGKKSSVSQAYSSK